jgi:DNA-binding XRE family transcriptional regulator
MPNQEVPRFFDLADVRVLVGKWSIDCGQLVAKKRGALGWDQETLAQIVGTTRATIHRIEDGKLTPRDYMKLAIAAALQCEVGDLWPYPTRKSVYEMAAVA